MGLLAVAKNGEWGFINEKCETVIPFCYDVVGSFSEGLAAVYLNGHWAYIDETGKEVITLK
jgi:hypothetical protein